MNKVIVIGGGGHAKVVMDVIRTLNEYQLAGFLDDADSSEITSCPHLGNTQQLGIIYADSMVLVCAIGDNKTRKRVVEDMLIQCKQHGALRWESFIHPSAFISPSAIIGHGTVIMPLAVVNADSRIGNHCIINTGAIVEHDCRVGDFCHVSPNATLCGKVEIGNGVHVGAGATIIQGLSVGTGSIVGAGAVVICNIPGHVTVKGIPAK
jgi:acetyltransferase EpsM